jgi:hypothetical protein
MRPVKGNCLGLEIRRASEPPPADTLPSDATSPEDRHLPRGVLAGGAWRVVRARRVARVLHFQIHIGSHEDTAGERQ